MTATKEWMKNVGESRTCFKANNFRQYLDKYDMVYGPMCANVKQASNGAVPQTHNEPIYQMASKSDNFDAYTSRCLNKVYFIIK